MKKKLSGCIEKMMDHKSILFFDLLAWRIKNHRLQASGAQLAYFTLLSIFPFLIVMLNIISRMSLLYRNVVDNLISFFPAEAGNVIYLVLSDLRLGFGSNLQLILSLLGALYSASLGIKPMITTCNLAYGYREHKKGLNLIITSLLFTLAFMALIILLFTTELLGDRIFYFIARFFSLPRLAYHIWYFVKNLLTPLYMLLLLFLLNRYSLPKSVRKEISIREILPGAFLTMILMIFLSSVFTIGAASSDRYAITYGSISGVIIMIVWLYLMGASLVLGFEINGVLHDMRREDHFALRKKRFFWQERGKAGEEGEKEGKPAG